ncbi:unnamed protein product, partial [Nesidiocoris tenuis]
VLFNKILEIKRNKVNILREMNTEAERKRSYSQDLTNDFVRKYASCIVELEHINSTLRQVLGTVQSQCQNFMPDMSMAAYLPSFLRNQSLEEAKEKVNVLKSESTDPALLDLVTELTALLIQIKFGLRSPWISQQFSRTEGGQSVRALWAAGSRAKKNFVIIIFTTSPIGDESSTETAQIPAQNYTTDMPSLDECGVTGDSKNRIVNGVASVLGAWPWMAVLGFKSRLTDEILWECGGTLITNRHVVTAAHCVKHPGITLELVRLGELNLDPMSVDGATPVDIRVSKAIIHSGYTAAGSHPDDIAIIVLERSVAFTTIIHSMPSGIEEICIQFGLRAIHSFGETVSARLGSQEIGEFGINLPCRKSSQCGRDKSGPTVCCPESGELNIDRNSFEISKPARDGVNSTEIARNSPGNSDLPDDCGVSGGSINRIVNGVASVLGAWPWMAVLGFKSSPTDGIHWECGGTLITNRHVVTAAHCLEETGSTLCETRGETFAISREIVRLGELNLDPNNDDGATPEDIRVSKTIVHPGYAASDAFPDDIAIVVLERPVTFTTCTSRP